MNGLKLKAAGLWEHVSEKGNAYLSGRLGGVKILILENRDAGEGEPTHTLFFCDGEKREDSGAPAQRSYQPPRRSSGRPPGVGPIRADSIIPMPADDGVDDLWQPDR